MRRTPMILLPLILALAGRIEAQDGHRRGPRGGGFPGGPGALVKRFLGDVSPEEKAALEAIGKEFLEAARPHAPELKAEVRGLRDTVLAALSEDERARVKEAIAGVRGLSIPEKIGLASSLVGSLNTAEMRADVRLFLRGAPEERGPAGDRVAKAAAAKAVGELARRAGIGEAKAAEVLAALDGFLARTAAARGALRELAAESLKDAWAILTPEQKERVKGALRLVRGWLQATAAPEGI